MAINAQHTPAFMSYEERIQTLLPEQYQDCYEEIQPVSMGSAALKYGADGRVAWDEIWGSFCDLAMAGGPPHRGTLLEPASSSDIDKQANQYQEVVDEICRGLYLVSGLFAEQSDDPGWVRIYCNTAAMARWLALAICMENVSAYSEGFFLSIPAGPAYRIEKEIKNVVTAFAKTCHYWLEHTSFLQHQRIANLFIRMDIESPLITSALPLYNFQPSKDELAKRIAESIHLLTGLRSSNHQYLGWLGIDCKDVGPAISIMRLLVVRNLFSRREGSVVFVPLNPRIDPTGETVVQIVDEVYRVQ